MYIYIYIYIYIGDSCLAGGLQLSVVLLLSRRRVQHHRVARGLVLVLPGWFLSFRLTKPVSHPPSRGGVPPSAAGLRWIVIKSVVRGLVLVLSGRDGGPRGGRPASEVVYIYIYIYTHVYIYIYISIAIHVYICITTYIYIYICTRVCIRIHIYIYTHMHIHICMRVYIYIYIHTHVTIISTTYVSYTHSK